MAATAEREGALVLRRTFPVSSAARRQALDITSQLRGAALATRVGHGLILVSCMHTTCSVIIVESGLDLFTTGRGPLG